MSARGRCFTESTLHFAPPPQTLKVPNPCRPWTADEHKSPHHFTFHRESCPSARETAASLLFIICIPDALLHGTKRGEGEARENKVEINEIKKKKAVPTKEI